MTWDGFADLFETLDELEHRAEALYELERIPDVADRSRAEYASVTLASRLMASLDTDVRLELTGVGQVAGRLRRVTAEWCLVAARAQDWVVRIDAVTVFRGASDRSVPELAWSPLSRLGFASALRRLADAGQRCVVRLRDGTAHDVVLRRVGADFVEADPSTELRTEHPAERVLIAYPSIAAVQSRED